MQKKLSWQAFSNGDRNTIIESVKNAISSNDGCIMNFNMFSDLALSLSIEIEAYKAKELYKSFSEILSINDDENAINSESKKELLIFMNISFGKGKGTLKSQIPAVPG
jgi:hypothetical protein